MTVKVYVPAAVGVPLISPAGLSMSPGGKAVLLAWAKVTGDVPPLVATARSSWRRPSLAAAWSG